MSVPALSRSLSDYFKPDWPYADDDWIVISSHNPKAVHRLGKWPSGVVDVACGSLAMTHAVRFRGRRKACWHHLVFYSTDTHQKVVVSLVKSQLLDLGRDKMWWCDEAEGGCGKTWWL